MTASWVMHASERPPCVAVAVREDRYSHDLILESSTFALSALRDDQVDVATHFSDTSGEYHDKLQGVPYGLTPGGSPFLLDCLAYLDCGVMDTRSGDHTVIVGEVTAGETLADGYPLSTIQPSTERPCAGVSRAGNPPPRTRPRAARGTGAGRRLRLRDPYREPHLHRRPTPLRERRDPQYGQGRRHRLADEAYEAARLCALNALAAAAAEAGGLNGISRVVKVTGFVASAPGFNAQPRVVNGARSYRRAIREAGSCTPAPPWASQSCRSTRQSRWS